MLFLGFLLLTDHVLKPELSTGHVLFEMSGLSHDAVTLDLELLFGVFDGFGSRVAREAECGTLAIAMML